MVRPSRTKFRRRFPILSDVCVTLSVTPFHVVCPSSSFTTKTLWTPWHMLISREVYPLTPSVSSRTQKVPFVTCTFKHLSFASSTYFRPPCSQICYVEKNGTFQETHDWKTHHLSPAGPSPSFDGSLSSSSERTRGDTTGKKTWERTWELGTVRGPPRSDPSEFRGVKRDRSLFVW